MRTISLKKLTRGDNLDFYRVTIGCQIIPNGHPCMTTHPDPNALYAYCYTQSIEDSV